ncbi:MAG: DUF2782 domain-containing protein [Burkholderiales bacterium]|nr:DUF2782 domain-containing protein [Burkholderiales bacterium]
MKNYYNMKKYFFIICGSAIIITWFSVTGCSIFKPNNDYSTIPLPPQKTSESDAVMPQTVDSKKTASQALNSSPALNNNRQTISETRANGEVTQIKVDNGDNYLPDYYMYPSQQQDLNTNSAPDKNLSTPSWQINW